jgi:hypothetical protein
MADSASGPTSLLHSADCPGCAADRTLTDEDKTFLDAHGWKHPGHSILPPPDPDPPGYRGDRKRTQRALGSVLLAAIGLFAVGAGFNAVGPWFVLVPMAGTAVWVHHVVRRGTTHTRKHVAPGLPDPLCGPCRRAKARDAARQREHDRELATVDAATRLRQTNAAHFQRLLHEHHKHRGLA